MKQLVVRKTKTNCKYITLAEFITKANNAQCFNFDIKPEEALMLLRSAKADTRNIGGTLHVDSEAAVELIHAIRTSPEDPAAQKRKELRKKLLSGEEVKVSQTGTIHDAKEKLPENQPAIRVPPGKLAASFFCKKKGARKANFFLFSVNVSLDL